MRSVCITLLLSVYLYQVSCSKKDNGCTYQDDNIVAPVAEQMLVKHYLDSLSITATKHASGFYYQVVSPGYGTVPGLCSAITVTYKGQLVAGSVFDQQTNFVYTLGGLIEGWKKGLPLISSGGEIKLYIPPSLGYGSRSVNTGTVVIPANAILIFDINLLNVQ